MTTTFSLQHSVQRGDFVRQTDHLPDILDQSKLRIFADDKCDSNDIPVVCLVYFKHIYFTSIEKQVLTTYTNTSRFSSLGTTPVLAPNVWANENLKDDTCSRESNSGPNDYEADPPLLVCL